MTNRRCKQWVNEPALIFHASYPDNIFHFMNDGYLAVLHTLVDSDLAPQHVTRCAALFASTCISGLGIPAKGLDM